MGILALISATVSAFGQLPNGTYKIIARHSGQALEANGTANQSTLMQQPYEGRTSQQWILTSLGGGQYSLKGVQSDRHLQVTGSSQSDDAEVRLYHWVDQANFKVTLTETEQGYYRINFVHSGKALAVLPATQPLQESPYNYGYKIVQRPFSNQFTAQWKFLPPGHVSNAGAPFEMIVLPDTQKYTNQWNGATHQMFYDQTAWISNQRNTRNIKYVAHVGDIVDNQSVLAQWQVADTAMATLDNTVPYGVTPGNHDFDWWDPTRPGQYYHQFFGAHRWSGKSYYGGSYGALSNDNHFDLITANGIDFVIVYLLWSEQGNPNQARYDWANSIFKAYPDRRGILVSHEIINPYGSWGWHGQQMYDSIKTNSNLFLTLCGHYGGEAIRFDKHGDHVVHSVLADYQGDVNGGNGKLRVLKFVPSEDLLRIETYSPTTNQWYTNPGARISIPFSMGIIDGAIYELEPLCAPGKRLEVRGGHETDGSNVSLWTDNNSSSQRWRAERQSDGSYEMVPQNATSSRLNVSGGGTANATNVDIWTDQNQSHQRWTLQGQTNGYYELIPKHAANLRLDVEGAGNANGTNVRVYNDNSSSAQHWKLIEQPTALYPIDGGIYELEPLCAPGKRLEVASFGTTNGSNVQIWTDANAASQRWQVQKQTDGSYELIPQHATTMRLEVSGASTAAGANVQIWTDANANQQRWILEAQSDGHYELIPKHATNLRLDVHNSLNANGTNVKVWTDANNSAQRWKLIKQP